jgi:hypothetical protein
LISAVVLAAGAATRFGSPKQLFVTATYDGVRSHPAVLARSAWRSIPDDGGRQLPVLLVACEDLTPPGDIDTPDLARDL